MTNLAIDQRPSFSGPRLRTLENPDGNRRASWLELFFDLVFALAVRQVAMILAAASDLPGFVNYVVLFIPIWYAWVGYTFYADRFESDEPIFRLLIFAGMFAVAGLSLTLGQAFTLEGDTPFTICYVLVLLVWAALYARAAYYLPLARAFCMQFVVGLATASMLLLISLFLNPPLRYAAWAIALLLEFAIPFVNVRATQLIPLDRSHLPERFGLFTIIVLGEAVISTAMGAATVHWNSATLAIASLGFAMAICIWWINFDFFEGSAIRSKSLVKRCIYMYGHFFIVASIVAIGVGVEHAIREANEPHLHASTFTLMAGGMAVYLATVMLVRLFTGLCDLMHVRIATIAFSLVLIFLGNFLSPVQIVTLMFLVLAIGICIEIRYSDRSTNRAGHEELDELRPCEHADEAQVYKARSDDGCEECRVNNYKWVHLRLCLSCGHVGCCDTSISRHATTHFQQTGHPLMASLETGEHWAWCYVDKRFIPLTKTVNYRFDTETLPGIDPISSSK